MDASRPKAQREAAKRSLARWRRRLAIITGSRISAAALRHVFPHLTRRQARSYGRALGAAFARYEIDTPRRAAAAIAQMGHESDRMRTFTEYASGHAYEGRRDLGNTHPGDGARFKGRGAIQITGRANYTAVSKALGHDFVARPADLAKPRWAALASCWWWKAHGCNELADSLDFRALTLRINGGLIGFDDRVALHAKAREVAGKLVPRRRG